MENYTQLKLGNSFIELLSFESPQIPKEVSQFYYQERNSKQIIKASGFLYVVFNLSLSESNQTHIIERFSLEIEEELDSHSFIVKPKINSIDIVGLAKKMQELSTIEIAEPDFHQSFAACEFTLPTDDLLKKQWYLNNDGKDPLGNNDWKLRKGADAKVFEAWNVLDNVIGQLGSDTITIAVLDKGFDLKHPDFEGKIVAPRDFSSWGNIEPFKIFDTDSGRADAISTNADHGTACAGIALAKSNGVGIVGVAPNAKFMPIVYNTGGGLDLRRYFRHIMENGGDVLSCSFGNLGIPMDSLAIRAIHECATEGRNGKGCVIVFATGNDYAFLKNNELATHPDVIAVGATTSEDTFAPYTNRTTSMSVCAPGGWGHTGTITTSDPGFLNRHGNLVPIGHGPNSSATNIGFVDHHHFYRFNAEGTSFACPIVAGAAALILSANPELTAKEVKSILEETADKIADASEYTLGHSPKFGHGRINTANAVRRAFNMPLKLYAPSEQPDTTFVKPFVHDYGLDIKGQLKIFESFALYKFTPKFSQVGKKLFLTLNVPVDHNKNNILTIFIRRGAEPQLLSIEHDFQFQLNEDMIAQGQINPLEPGDYFIKIMNYNPQEFGFTKGGGDFTLNLTVENNMNEAIADIGFHSEDIVRV